MCGIAGYIGKEPLPADVRERTLVRMFHRGPDASGQWEGRCGHRYLHMLHRRLAIIDLDARSNQPYEIDGLVVVYNGEIYNYLELRRELQSEGVSFRTESDTEVLLRAYQRWGMASVNRFEGMWAFALVDSAQRCVYLCRDRFSEKPLYYRMDKDRLVFGSEVKFLETLLETSMEIDLVYAGDYLVKGFRSMFQNERTFFCGVSLLSGAHWLRFDCDTGHVERREYWEPHVGSFPGSIEEAAVETKRLFLRSMELRLRSDVPIAFCLSGGIDSSAAISCARKVFGTEVHAFSVIEDDERYHELSNIQCTVQDLGCSFVPISVSRDGFLRKLGKLVEAHDGPLVTISYYVHSLLSEHMARCGYKVAISGTGADELFAGYYHHHLYQLADVYGSSHYQRILEDWRRHIRPFIRSSAFTNPDFVRTHPVALDHLYIGASGFRNLLIEPRELSFSEHNFECGSLLKNRMLNELMYEVVPAITHDDDLNSMLYSVENRSPFLDSELAAFALSLPPHFFARDGYSKYVLREALRGMVHETVRTDRRKIGFNASINSLVDFDDPPTRKWLLGDSPVYDLVSRSEIAPYFQNGATTNEVSKVIFNFINLKLFFDQRAGLTPELGLN